MRKIILPILLTLVSCSLFSCLSIAEEGKYFQFKNLLYEQLTGYLDSNEMEYSDFEMNEFCLEFTYDFFEQDDISGPDFLSTFLFEKLEEFNFTDSDLNFDGFILETQSFQDFCFQKLEP
ncbi:MAG: hypothetical protein K5839_01125 [Treponemataceae bacterium]|nr:hypothetical protein [Treponemataceae bacterium]